LTDEKAGADTWIARVRGTFARRTWWERGESVSAVGARLQIARVICLHDEPVALRYSEVREESYRTSEDDWYHVVRAGSTRSKRVGDAAEG